MSYRSPNAPGKRDVLGTWLLSILAGHKRYAHITGLRGDALSPQILGMEKIISCAGLASSRAMRSFRRARRNPFNLRSLQHDLSSFSRHDLTPNSCPEKPGPAQ